MAKLDVPATRLLVEHNAPVEVRDGTVLRADIFRTEAARFVPIMLIRNPYGEPMMRSAPVLPADGASAATATEEDFVMAEQTILHDAGHPSHITLPVIPR